MSLFLTDDKSTLAQVMSWFRQATNHYLSQRRPRFMLPYITRPQWVNVEVSLAERQTQGQTALTMTISSCASGPVFKKKLCPINLYQQYTYHNACTFFCIFSSFSLTLYNIYLVGSVSIFSSFLISCFCVSSISFCVLGSEKRRSGGRWESVKVIRSKVTDERKKACCGKEKEKMRRSWRLKVTGEKKGHAMKRTKRSQGPASPKIFLAKPKLNENLPLSFQCFVWFPQNFAHVLTAMLLLHAQKFLVIMFLNLNLQIDLQIDTFKKR